MAKIIKQKAIICDIDGVLLDTEHIFEQIEKAGLSGSEKWDYFNRHANDYDVEIDPRVVEMLDVLSKDFQIIFMTARSEEIWKQTRAKIAQAIGLYSSSIFNFDLAMRGQNDKRTSAEVKADLLKKAQRFFDIVFAIDDDSENCEMFAQNGILTLQVKKRG